MLSRGNLAIIFSSLLTAALATGCIIVADPGTTGGTGGSGGAGVGGTGGTGDGGRGGEGGAGVGGQGGQGGQGGVGGGSQCVDASEGSGTSVQSCEQMNITPLPNGAALSVCGDSKMEAPPGYLICKRGFDIYSQGAAYTLQTCLDKIGVEPANACDEAQVSACLGDMYKAICASPAATETCNAIAGVCGADPFDTQGCTLEVNPFNDKTLQALVECINNKPNDPCQTAYDTCFGEISSY